MILARISELVNSFCTDFQTFLKETIMYEIYCKLRDSLGLKDADIVKATGITKSTFSDWKSGRSKPKQEKLQKIADFFSVSLEYLMTGQESSKNKSSEFTTGLYENVKNAANAKGYSINRLEKELGFARSYIGKFKTITPSIDKIQKIADFLDVSVDSLMTGQESSKEKSSELNARDERNIAKDLDDIMEKLTNKEDGPLNYNGIDLDDDTISLLSDAIGLGLRQIKIRNKEKYTPKKYKK